MAVSHTYRWKDGYKHNKALTRAKAIREKCLDCCCWSAPEVKMCSVVACPLWPYRLGRAPESVLRSDFAAYVADFDPIFYGEGVDKG